MNARISNKFMWCNLLTKFASYKVPPVMVSTYGSIVSLAMLVVQNSWNSTLPIDLVVPHPFWITRTGSLVHSHIASKCVVDKVQLDDSISSQINGRMNTRLLGKMYIAIQSCKKCSSAQKSSFFLQCIRQDFLKLDDLPASTPL